MAITRYYVTSDAMGSVTGVLDEEGTVIERRNYDAFGAMTCMTPDGTPVAESPTKVDVGFQGQIRDSLTGAYQMGFRWYCPTLGRWTSPDPLRLIGGVNLFCYGANKTTTHSDPYGLMSEVECAAKRAVLVGEVNRHLKKYYPSDAINCEQSSCCSKITIIIDLGDPCKGLLKEKVGHTGVGIEDRYFDWGPDERSNREDAGGPYWAKNKDGRDLEDLLQNIGKISKGDPIVKLELCVTKEDAQRMRSFWGKTYSQAESFRKTGKGSGYYGTFKNNCTDVACGSLLSIEDQGAFASAVKGKGLNWPLTALFDAMTKLVNTCGPSKNMPPSAQFINT